MPDNSAVGKAGELDVCLKVKCPNCGRKLVPLPTGYPLADIQCCGCAFRAQVKTNNCKPKNIIFGAGWDILEKTLKAGYLMPPLIANFVWMEKNVEHQQILFFPFVPKKHLLKHQLSEKARRSGYRMFNYIDLLKLPYFVLFKR